MLSISLRTEGGRRNAKRDIATRGLAVEVILRDPAGAGVAAGIDPAADDEQRMHAAIARAVRAELEARLAHRSVQSDEGRHLVTRSECGGQGKLRIAGAHAGILGSRLRERGQTQHR
jgi:hypothetical protein